MSMARRRHGHPKRRWPSRPTSRYTSPMPVFASPFCLSLLLLLAACSSEQNDPYPRAERGQNILYSAFTERPKHLDPVQSYTEDEITFTAQIYEPPLQYHYLKRPYTLIPATSEAVPVPRYYDAQGRELPADAPAARDRAQRLRDSHSPGHPLPAASGFCHRRRPAAGLSRSRREQLRGIETIADFARPAAASWSPTTTSTRSSAWRIRACIRRSSA
jgi:hypothetical protein